MRAVDSETLKVYIKLLKYGKPVGVREAQRLLGYRSPGKTQRVLERLVKANLAFRNENGDYVIVKELPPQLASYMVIRKLILPRSLVYATFTTTFVVTYTLLTDLPAHLVIVLAIV
ncbi:MAG: hypothetical protein DRO18_01960, partial [Thermoprotei archaeon]